MSTNPNALAVAPLGDIEPQVDPDMIALYVPDSWVDGAGVTPSEVVEMIPRDVSPVLKRSLGRVADQAVMPVGDIGNVNRDVMAFNSSI